MKIFYIILLVITIHQYDTSKNNTAQEIFINKLDTINKSLTDTNMAKQFERISAIVFEFEELTGIHSESPIMHFSIRVPTQNDYIKWLVWYNEHYKDLKWNTDSHYFYCYSESCYSMQLDTFNCELNKTLPEEIINKGPCDSVITSFINTNIYHYLEIHVDSIEYIIGYDDDKIVRFICTFSTEFLSPESVSIGMTYEEVNDKLNVKLSKHPIHKVYFTKLPSGWNALYRFDNDTLEKKDLRELVIYSICKSNTLP